MSISMSFELAQKCNSTECPRLPHPVKIILNPPLEITVQNKRRIPVELSELLENWVLRLCETGWKLVTHIQDYYFLESDRVPSCLQSQSPILFSIYIDDIRHLQNNLTGTFVVLYVDDILLLAPSVTALQWLLRACEQELDSIDTSIKVKMLC